MALDRVAFATLHSWVEAGNGVLRPETLDHDLVGLGMS